MKKPPDQPSLFQDIRNFLTFQREMGITDYPDNGEFRNFLKLEPDCLSKAPPDKAARIFSLGEIHQELEFCRDCPLHQNRVRVIPGTGRAASRLMIIEDQPAGDEERSGQPFSGDRGAMLDRMLKGIGLTRQDVYLTSLVKCRPVRDTAPKDQEINSCLKYLARQISAVNPLAILAMGSLTAQKLSGRQEPLFRLRGNFFDYHGTPVMATFHPEFLIKNQEMKKGTWADLLAIKKRLMASPAGA